MSLGIKEVLNDLTLEETDQLVKPIDEVTIDTEIKARILNKSLEKAEIDPKKVVSISSKKRYRRWVKVAASIAAIFLVGSATAYATGIIHGLSGYFTGEINQYEDKLSKTIQVASNKDYEISVDGVIADKNQCIFAVSLKGLSVKGKLEVAKFKDQTWGDIAIYAKLKDTTKKRLETFVTGQRGDQNDSYLFTVTKEDLGVSSLEQVESFEIYYKEDVKLEANVIQTGETIPLYAEKKTSLKQVEMSPIGFEYLAKNYNHKIGLIKNKVFTVPLNRFHTKEGDFLVYKNKHLY